MRMWLSTPAKNFGTRVELMPKRTVHSPSWCGKLYVSEGVSLRRGRVKESQMNSTPNRCILRPTRCLNTNEPYRGAGGTA
jgi:hypothetical protein